MGLLHGGDAPAAAAVCATALRAAPDNVDLLTLRGVALLDCRRPRDALEPLQRAVERAPRFAPACAMTSIDAPSAVASRGSSSTAFVFRPSRTRP